MRRPIALRSEELRSPSISFEAVPDRRGSRHVIALEKQLAIG